MKNEHINEIKAIIILAIGIIILASLISFVPEDLPWYTSHPNSPAKNLIRIVGAYWAGSLLFTFGYSSYFVPLFLFFWSWNKFSNRELSFSWPKIFSFLILFCVLSGLFSLIGSDIHTLKFQRGGMLGLLLSDFLLIYCGRAGAYIILFTLSILNLILIGEFLISPLLLKLGGNLKGQFGGLFERFQEQKEKISLSPSSNLSLNIKEKIKNISKPITALKPEKKTTQTVTEDDEDFNEDDFNEEASESSEPKKPKIKIVEPSENDDDSVRDDEPIIVGEYHLPTLDLLDDPPLISSSKLESDLMSGAKMLEGTLANFGVSVRVADVERGPVITRYELEPAVGVKVQRITTLADDIALAMQAPSVRIVAPIPGKNRVGIEVPNGTSSSVYLKDILHSSLFTSPKSKLMLALGKDIAGAPMVADLVQMPHLLVAGTTGAGKTVCINGLIMSMVFNASPDEVKFLMVDPKMVELVQYNDLPHCLCPAVTDPKKVSAALNWVVGEMESRYTTLSKAKVRNITAYHAQGHRLPYIVVIIDELADLMQVAAKNIESAITRLAQLSRAVGIHLILATQRPSVDVITGVIKANFPARISFKVASKVDSRTVLDMNGAENLIGQGDMLFLKPGDAKPTRGQCNFVSDNEIHRVIDYIKTQQIPTYNDSILQHQKHSSTGGVHEKDELYDDAVRLVIETNQASVSILQRRMRLGYTRAARLIDMMEQNGIVGPYCGSKPRDILVDREEWLLNNMNPEDNEEDDS